MELITDADFIFIHGDVPSSKNAKGSVAPGVIVHSAAYKKWMLNTHEAFLMYAPRWADLTLEMGRPILVGMHFVRARRQLFDFGNMAQGVCDAMVDHRWVEDDNILEIIPVPMLLDGVFCSLDVGLAGVFIKPFYSDYFIDYHTSRYPFCVDYVGFNMEPFNKSVKR